MLKIKEVIVVEGKNDINHLSSFISADFLKTDGLRLDRYLVKLIDELNKKQGVILFFDPDSAGNKIRNYLNERIPNLKNAFVLKKDAKTSKKVGVEHASKEVILKSLANLISYEDKKQSIKISDLIEIGILDNKLFRNHLCAKLSLGHCNQKTFIKRLNYLAISKERLKEEYELYRQQEKS